MPFVRRVRPSMVRLGRTKLTAGSSSGPVSPGSPPPPISNAGYSRNLKQRSEKRLKSRKRGSIATHICLGRNRTFRPKPMREPKLAKRLLPRNRLIWSLRRPVPYDFRLGRILLKCDGGVHCSYVAAGRDLERVQVAGSSGHQWQKEERDKQASHLVE